MAFRSRLRCADHEDMILPCTQTACCGPCSFHVVAPQTWYMLPSHFKDRNNSQEQFKSDRKTWLFVQAYSE